MTYKTNFIVFSGIRKKIPKKSLKNFRLELSQCEANINPGRLPLLEAPSILFVSPSPSPLWLKLGAMEKLLILLISLLMAMRSSWGDDNKLLSPSKLEMFVDDLPIMPKVQGFSVRDDGALVPGNLTIGMFQKLWVSVSALSLSFSL